MEEAEGMLKEEKEIMEEVERTLKEETEVEGRLKDKKRR